MPPPKHGSNLLRNLLIILAAVIPVGILLGPKFIIYRILLNESREGMDEYGKKIWEDMHTVPIDIPEEWLEEPNFPEDLLELVDSRRDFLYHKNWDYLDQDLSEKLREGVDLSGEDRDAIQDFLLSQDARIQSVSAIVQHPDYRFGVGVFTQPDLNLTLLPFTAAVSVKTMWAIHLLRISSTLESACNLAEDFRDSCTDSQVLTELSKHLTEIHSWVRMSEPDNPINYLAYGDLKFFEEINMPVEIEPGMTMIEYTYSLGDQENKEELIGQLSLKSLWEKIVVYPVQKFWGVYELGTLLFLQNDLETLERMRKVNALLDLVRLNLANRILELEGRPLATRPSDLVPEFFEEEPIDPFSGKSFLWDDEEMIFYSERVREIEAELEESRKASKQMMESGGAMYGFGGPYGGVWDATESSVGN